MEQLYMAEKWKLSKKGGCSCSKSMNASYSRRSSMVVDQGAVGATTGPILKASASTREARNMPKTKTRTFTSRCANLVKEQRAKFYIMRRCVTMLICWQDYS